MRSTWLVSVVALSLCLIGFTPLTAQAGDCSPDAGFEWCYEHPNPWSYAPKIQVDINYNTTVKNGYTVAQGQYTMRFKCNGTLYYNSTSCWEGGCNGENLGGGTSQKVIGTAYAANPQMKEIRCYTEQSSGWAYASFNPWTSNVYVVHCYDDGHCSQCNHCATSGNPSGWQCQLDQETCNGQDDDCDGQVDENWPSLGTSCEAGVGECHQVGVTICKANGSGTQCSVSGGTPQTELCDGLDNDCDGGVDETFPLGDLCEVGVGQCMNQGALECTANGAGTECSVEPFPPQTELCDGLDNDCDGGVDESFPLGDPCTVGIGQCANAGTLLCRIDGLGTECSAMPLAPQAELCDGLDNDCDGAMDEDFPLNDPCEVGIGQCVTTGALVCALDGAGTTCDADPLPAQAEICDGLDNDCDGDMDEDFPLGDACTLGLGICAASGALICAQDGAGTACDAEPFPPQAELCDGLDNNCDGSIDEVFPLGEPCTVGVGQCFNQGAVVCKADGLGTECSEAPLPPQTELCDDLDNDCDGDIDEDFDAGDVCTVGVGECANQGIMLCTVNGLETLCSVAPLPTQTELCDSLDNDCDGDADEDFDVGHACSVGTGECANLGVLVCAADALDTECSVEPLATQPELCDGLDNDCDGDTDEDFDIGVLCSVGVGECMKGGISVCTGDGTAAECNESPLAPQEELCDGLDNDCDGDTDEDYPLGDPCTVGAGQCVATGTLVCGQDGAGTECSVDPLPGQIELCDGLDNDCDEEIDEGFPLGEACTVGIGECAQVGEEICLGTGFGTECSAEPLEPQDELCDDLDNDCDGDTDEDYPLDEVCTVGIGECANDGVLICSEDGEQTECDVEPLPAQDEICDGLDNDCDGTVDPGCECLIGESRDCGPDLGECVQGTQTCEDGAWGPCEGGQGAADEVCDDLDNDCDGDTDEDGACWECTPGEEESCVPESDLCDQGLRSCNDKGLWEDCLPVAGCVPDTDTDVTGSISDVDDDGSADAKGWDVGVSGVNSGGCGAAPTSAPSSPWALLLLAGLAALLFRRRRKISSQTPGWD